MRRLVFLCFLISLSFAVLSGAQPQNHNAASASSFTLNCTLPFDNIATKPDPFVNCDKCGTVSGDPNTTVHRDKGAQSQAKNNFCADTSSVTIVTVTDLRGMQRNLPQALVTANLPDRSRLQVTVRNHLFHEGDVVRLKALVKDAHYSDCGEGESVNCDTGGSTHNDVHIVLVDPDDRSGTNQDECSSVTAEMSPHFRPAAWSSLNKKIPTQSVVRLTGPLFFDNAHASCAGLTQAVGDRHPFRSSLWEIHPVYQFEVCTSVDFRQCDVNSNSATLWKPYHQWVNDPGSHTEATTFRERCSEPGTRQSAAVPALCPASSGPPR